MATLTIKIESEDLAREVLTHMGYLPEDDIPDLVSVKDEDEEEDEPVVEEAPRTPKTHIENIIERMKGLDLYTEERLPLPTRKMPETQKQNAFCKTEEPVEPVEPVDNEMGAPLEVYSDEAKNEREELYKQSKEIHVPPAEERLKTQLDGLLGGDRLDYLDVMADHDDPAMRKAVKAYVLKEYVGRNLKLWPALQKILDGNA